MLKYIIAFTALFVLTANTASADLTLKHMGLNISGAQSKEEVSPKLLDLKAGMTRIAKAIDLIYAKSSFSASKLETLKKNGEVFIIYSPTYQKEKIGAFALASFFPDYYKKDSNNPADKRFIVIVGPHAIKWPTAELAMIIVHELVGHGIQHLQGRLDYIRVLDLECAANLYGEKFYQDLGINKKKQEVIKFRKELEEHWCSDFKRHMRKTDPKNMALWDVLNPDIPRLLNIFNTYVNDLRDSGVSGKAIENAKKQRLQKLNMLIQQANTTANAKDQHSLAVTYKDGLGVPVNVAEAIKWFRKAADQGYAKSQYQLGVFYAKGKGLPKDSTEAARLYTLAANQGDIFAQAQLGVMRITGHGLVKNNLLANFWLTLAKDDYPQGKNRNIIVKAWKNTQKKLSRQQRKRVEALVRDWRNKKYPPS